MQIEVLVNMKLSFVVVLNMYRNKKIFHKENCTEMAAETYYSTKRDRVFDKRFDERPSPVQLFDLARKCLYSLL